MGLKHHYPDVTFNGNAVTPDELDVYNQYQVINPAIAATHVGSATAGTANAVTAIGFTNVTLDYPRNLAVYFSGSAAVSGTVSVIGKNQFGQLGTEAFALAQGTQVAGTPAGTQIFAQITAATATFGTGVIGTGTASIGVDIVGTTLLFGLPSKIQRVADVKAITWSSTGGISLPINGGTITSSHVSTATHAFRGTGTLAGTQTYTVLFRSTYASQPEAVLASGL